MIPDEERTAPPELPDRRTDARFPMSAQRLQHPPLSRRRHAAVRPRLGTFQTLVAVAVGGVLLFVLAVAILMTITEKLGDTVPRVPDAFNGLHGAARPPAAPGKTFLLVGTDTRSDMQTTGTRAEVSPGAARSDVVMIARLAGDGRSAAVVSIPRDSWVDIPGHGPNKINAAYALGGPSLLINTVENLTALHIDHFAVVDFAGFRSIVDSVGGIEVGIAEDTSNAGVDFHRGVNHLDGTQALAYVRQRHGLADGDLDRAQRQQNALRAVLMKVAATGVLDDPVGLYRLLDSVGQFVSVDDTLSNGGLRSVTQQMRGVPPDNVSFLRAPVERLGREGTQSVVYLDTAQAGELWESLRTGTMTTYAQKHSSDSLGPVTN